MRLYRILSACLLLAPVSGWALPDGEAFFESKVRPILVERCYECHSAEKKIKGGLRLDIRDGWAKGGDAGPAILPGNPEESLLIEAVEYKSRDLLMPPKHKLPAAELAILQEWVKRGAPDPRTEASVETKKSTALAVDAAKNFWCYAPIANPAPPAVQDSAWSRGPIDRFILARIEAAGLKPARDAEPESLVRRLYFTLIGLPPTPEQIDDFTKRAAADREGAIAALVDDLLASPHFGEAWARRWLDVARFAESSGGGRTLLFKDAWRFRDYVIDAFNRDLPFDRFIKEQLAGDILPAENVAEQRRQLTATAFLALGPTNYEEQDKQQLRFDVIDEQLETLGRAFMGQTISCARCHDHKFDPISQKDYYAMAGILASTRTLFNYTDNVARWIAAPLPADGPDEAALREHEAQLAGLQKEAGAVKAKLTKLTKAVSEPTSAPGTPVAPADLPGIVIDDADAKVVGNWKHSRHVRSFVGEGYLSDNNEGKGEKSITFTPAIPTAGRYEVRLAYTFAAGRANNVRVNVFHADGEDAVYIDQTEPPPIDGRFVSLGKFRFEKDGAGYVLIGNEDTKGYVTIDALQFLPEGGTATAAVSPADSAEVAELKKRAKQLDGQIAKLKKSGPQRDTVMAVRDDDQAADTHIRVRGIEKQRGESVPRGFLTVAMTPNAPRIDAAQSGRRELAEWIASGENPLTARVAVNRVWAWLFGTGIVRTVDLFSTTGEKPSHPELLDYLASRFVQEGWSIKKLVREIVLTRAWQQAITAPTAADPENRLFAHANRRRLDADQIRDAILTTSGALDLTIGGPNIVSAGEIDANSTAAQNIEYGYVYADTRRSVYTPAFRNKRLELFEVFDFGDANQSSGQRHVSTVAPQALYLLNHPFVIEQAKLSASRTISLNGSDEERLTLAFRRALGRPPTPAEREQCLAFLRQPGVEPAEAWAQVQQVLFACIDFRYLN